MQYYVIQLQKDINEDEACLALTQFGAQVFSCVQDVEGGIEIYAFYGGASEKLTEAFPFIVSVTGYDYEGVDWEQQWQQHGGDFHEGYVHLDLSPYKNKAPCLRMQPGPGFGDLSHPSTRLVIKMLSEIDIEGFDVVDIGCGSGVLSLAAIALGARHVWAVDIDEGALKHAEDNAIINGMQDNISFSLPWNFLFHRSERPLLVLMNMISSEQKAAWESMKPLHSHALTLITSGIPKEEESDYTHAVQTRWGWKHLATECEEGWCAFLMTQLGS